MVLQEVAFYQRFVLFWFKSLIQIDKNIKFIYVKTEE